MNEKQALLINNIEEEYKKTYQGQIPENILNETLNSIGSIQNQDESQAYSITITTQSYVFYTYVTIEWDHTGKTLTKTFKGNAGGIGIGGGKTSGLLYLVNGITLEQLYQKTESFQINTTLGMSNVNIFDSNNKPLAHAIAGGAQIGAFLGGGTANWE